jgi:hypothetical protein
MTFSAKDQNPNEHLKSNLKQTLSSFIGKHGAGLIPLVQSDTRWVQSPPCPISIRDRALVSSWLKIQKGALCQDSTPFESLVLINWISLEFF